MRPSAGIQIEIANVDQAQILALGGRDLAYAHGARLIRRGETNLHSPVFCDDFVGQSLHRQQLFRADGAGREVDGTVLVAHVERYRRHVIQLLEGRRQHMLARMLLHVVAPTLAIDHAAYDVPRLHG